MSTNWQEPHGAAPPPPPRNQPNPKRRFAIVGILLVVIAGLAAAAGLVLVNRGGDDVADEAQYVVMDSPTVTPVFEPRDARGNDPFFPLETQLLTFQQEVEEEIENMVDEQVMAAEASGEENVTIEVPTFDVAELDAAVKTGLYGGTEENTCDPERLISFLIANPEIGEAWAAVQGIPFSAIPSYIRSLEVRVLAEPVNVLNHGYDPVSGAAYEIDAVLDAGTAVLVDEQVMAAEASGEENVTIEVPTFNVAELDAAVKTGLYGGTEENTCDPERLISFLIANPEIGEAWAAVQGIPFSAIPSYIRSLEVRVLAEPVNVLNHGYDPVSGAAYEIDAVLDAGTAVLVDENGDIRTRCYCGNPIKPKPPVGHMPPRCIVFGASVFVVPGGGAKREDAPRDVLLTGQETTLASGAHWTEVKWGNGDTEKGWVETWNLRKHYCPPPEVDVKCPGPDTTNVYANDRTTVVGQVTGTLNTPAGPQDIFGPIDPVGFPGDETIVDGFVLVHFTQAFPSVQNSGWVALADLQNDDCFEIPMCIDLQDNFVRDRAGGAVLGADLTGKLNVRFSGHFAAAAGDWAEIDILDGSGRTGWMPLLWHVPLTDSECEIEYNDCIAGAIVWDASTGGNPIALVADGRVSYDAPPVVQDGRVQVNLPGNGPTGWIDEVAALSAGVDDCRRPICVQMPGQGHEIWTNGGGTVGPIATPFYVDYLGVIAIDGVDNYIRISYLGTDYWIQDGNIVLVDEDRCRNLTPECPQTPYRSAVDDFAPDRLRIVSPDLATEFPEPMGDDNRPQPVTTCCVTALYVAPGGALAPAIEYPAYVTVLDSQDVAGTIWFQTVGGRYFTAADIDFTERSCQDPGCPDDLKIPGIRDALDRASDDDDVRITVAPLTIIGDDFPEIEPSGDCCVRALYFDMALSVPVPAVGPFLIDVDAGPFAGNVYRTTTGFYFDGAHVLAAEHCDGPVDCPTPGDDDGGPIPGYGDDVSVYASTYIPELLSECCVDGDYFDDANGALMGTWAEPTKVAILDVDGDWYLVGTIDSMPALAVWVHADSFVDTDECNRDDVDPGCPDFSLIRIDDEGRQVCCVADNNSGFLEVTLTGTVAFIGPDLSYETVELGFIDGDRFVGAGRCDVNEDANCPTLAIISALTPNECCVASAAAGPFIVEITGETRDIGGGVLEYNTVDHGWILESQFTFAGECEVDPCPNGEIIDGVCCGKGQELFAGQCVDPCRNGQRRDSATGRCFTPETVPQPEPTPEPTTPPLPTCPSGLIDNAGNCCSDGQALINGVCVNPCDLFGGDVDGDGICGDEDPCPRDPTNTCLNDPCLDLGGDTDGDGICDQRDECPNDPTNDCQNPCGSVGDRDNDGICDPQDECPDDPFNYCNEGFTTAPGSGGVACSDQDKDGFCDDVDLCPTVWTQVNQYPYQSGCFPLSFAVPPTSLFPPSN